MQCYFNEFHIYMDYMAAITDVEIFHMFAIKRFKDDRGSATLSPKMGTKDCNPDQNQSERLTSCWRWKCILNESQKPRRLRLPKGCKARGINNFTRRRATMQVNSSPACQSQQYIRCLRWDWKQRVGDKKKMQLLPLIRRQILKDGTFVRILQK